MHKLYADGWGMQLLRGAAAVAAPQRPVAAAWGRACLAAMDARVVGGAAARARCCRDAPAARLAGAAPPATHEAALSG